MRALVLLAFVGACAEPQTPADEPPLVDVEPTNSATSLPEELADPGPPATEGCPLLLQQIESRASELDRGMTAMAIQRCARLGSGEHMEVPVTLQPGRCMTVLARGEGVTEIDIRLLFEMPGALGGPPLVAAQARGGESAELGPPPNCYKNPLPLAFPGRLDVQAVTGAGLVALEAFEK
jgi:hypothetical protein